MLTPPQGIGEFRYSETTLPAVAVGDPVAKQSGNRVLLVVSGASALTGSISTLNNTGTGFGLHANRGNTIEVSWEQYGSLVNADWFWSGMAGASISVFELFYQPTHNKKV